MNTILNDDELSKIEAILSDNLIESGIKTAILIDVAGNVISCADNSIYKKDAFPLAALVAGNFGAMNSIAKILGEEEFSLLFHKGKENSIYLTRVGDNFILITVFDDNILLGFVRLKIDEVITQLKKIQIQTIR